MMPTPARLVLFPFMLVWKKQQNMKRPRFSTGTAYSIHYMEYEGMSTSTHFSYSNKSKNWVCRVEICRDRHDQRSCKICASCVNFPGKQRNLLHNLRRTARFTHTKCDFALQLLKFRYESSTLIRTA